MGCCSSSEETSGPLGYVKDANGGRGLAPIHKKDYNKWMNSRGHDPRAHPHEDLQFFKDDRPLPARGKRHIKRNSHHPSRQDGHGGGGGFQFDPRAGPEQFAPQHQIGAPPHAGQSQEARGPSMAFQFPQNGKSPSRHSNRAPSRHSNHPPSRHSNRAPSRHSNHPNQDRISAHDFANPAPNHPPPRAGKLPEGAPLPPGVRDPLATVSKPRSLGHYGQRPHVPGMTNLDLERHGPADDPSAGWKRMEEINRLREGGGGGSGRRSGGGGGGGARGSVRKDEEIEQRRSRHQH